MQDTSRGQSARRSGALARAIGMAIVFSVVSLGCKTVVPAPLPPAHVHPPYLIGPPDKLLISVLPEPIIEREVTVRPDGFITVDLVGDVKAAGRTPGEVSADVQKRMARFKRDALVSISVREALSDAITVFGEVVAPGTFPLERDMRLSDAIGVRGCTSKFAAKGRVRVIRMQHGEPLVIQSDFGAIEKGDLSTNVALQKGDIVVVPPTYFAVVGYKVSALLFPFNPILSAMAGAGLASLF